MRYVFSSTIKAKQLFVPEKGIHSWQRVPPTESRGRVHTSTIIVTVIDDEEYKNDYVINESEIERIVTRGSGPCEQHRNKVESCVELRHKPTGIKCRIDGRSQIANDKLCKQILISRIQQHFYDISKQSKSAEKRKQGGTGERSESIRTYNYKIGTVVNHLNNKKMTIKEFFKGEICKLH